MPVRAEKVAEVEALSEQLKGADVVLFADYRGLDVAQITELRRQCREADVQFKVVKNTLMRRAADKAGVSVLEDVLVGPTAVAFGAKDPVAPAKALFNFSKNYDALELKGGLLDGAPIGTDKIEALAALPSREELLAKLLAGMQSPITGLVGVLQGTVRSLVCTLEAVRREKEAQGA